MGEEHCQALRHQESKMMWSFTRNAYVPADEYYEIDGDCRLVVPIDRAKNPKVVELEHPDQNIAHCPSEAESFGFSEDDEHQTLFVDEKGRTTCPGDVWE